MMDKFEKRFGKEPDVVRQEAYHIWHMRLEAWQEATKQRDAQYELMAEHTELSIREDAIIGERERIEPLVETWKTRAIKAEKRAADRFDKRLECAGCTLIGEQQALEVCAGELAGRIERE